MIAAVCASLTCSLALLALEARELRVSCVVAMVWIAAAPLVRATSTARAALLVSGAALPFYSVAFIADAEAGAPWREPLSITALSLGWSALLSASATRAAHFERGAAHLALWLFAASLGPLITVASRSAGQDWAPAAWLNQLSGPWWLVEHAFTGVHDSWSAVLSSAAAPSAVLLALLALSGRGRSADGGAHDD